MEPARAAPQIVNGIVSGGRHLDREALALRSRKAGALLRALGVGSGDRIALLMRNDIAWFEATQGAALLGASTVPLNWHLTAPELGWILEDSDARALIVHADLLSEALLEACVGREVAVVETPPEISHLLGTPATSRQASPRLRDWGADLERQEPLAGETALVQPLFYTSGTTGRPKGVLRQRISAEAALSVGRRTMLAFGLDGEGVRAVMTGPLYHSAPNSYAMRVAAIGGLLLLQPRFDAAALLQLIETWRITHLHMVPTMFVRLLALPEDIRLRHDLSSLRFVCHGSAPCPLEVKQRMIDWWGPVIHEYYAMTETGIITVSDSPGWLAHPGSVGRAAPGVQIRITDADGSPCPTGSPGEIQVSSETTPYFAYHRAEQKTAEAREGDFVRTGDIGFLDADGYLTISDRKSDMVISGGVNIYPAEVEKDLIALPGVRDCAVFGIPDAEYGERLVAVVESAGPLDGAGLAAALAERIARYKIPREFRCVERLPREDSGKIKKRLLREQWA
ncbi:MAG: AMP-binding protein, partial [Gammaproteobacteria bacterium]